MNLKNLPNNYPIRLKLVMIDEIDMICIELVILNLKYREM